MKPELENGDRITVVLNSGEEFDVTVVGFDERGLFNNTAESSCVDYTLEGEDIWEQVNDRVESEVLNLRYKSPLGTKSWTTTLYGTIWVGEPKESSTPEYKKLGDVREVRER